MARPGRWLLAVAVLVAGCGSAPAGPATAEERWVVESSSFNRFSDTHFVTCVPADQAERGYGDRWRDGVVGPDQAYAAESGDPCPVGPVRDSHSTEVSK